MRKKIGKIISKNLICKNGQKFLDHAKQSVTVALKTASKRAIQKIAKAASVLIGNKISNKIARASRASPKNKSETNEEEILIYIYIYIYIYISQELKQKSIDDLRLKEEN